MGIKDQITPEQWKALLNAPSYAAEYVATASGGSLDFIQEVFTSMKVVQDTAVRKDGSGFGKLVDEIISEMSEMTFKEAREDSIKTESTDMTSMREAAKTVVVDAAAAASSLEGGDGYKRWLLYVARKVAETRTGGVLGFGGSSTVDAKEEAALAELKAILNITEM